MREDALPQPVSPYGVSKLAAEQLCYLYFVNYGVPAVSLRYFTVYGPRQRPDMGFHKFLRATLRASRSRSSATASRRATSPSSPMRSSATIAAATRGVPGRVYNIGGGSRVSVNDVLEMIGRVAGPPADRYRRRRSEGRHAAHLCRHVAGARGPRVRADGRPRSRAWRPNIVAEAHAGHVVVNDRSRAFGVAVRVARRPLSRRRRVRPARRAAARPCPPGTAQPDKFLFDKGNDGAAERRSG